MQLKALSDTAPDFTARLAEISGQRRLGAAELQTLQINVGKVCNQACRHCHVDASPMRSESMNAEVAQLCLQALARLPGVDTVDITGGAPELNPNFRMLVRESRALGKLVIDRCNLTILQEPGQEDLAEFLASQQAEIVASLPHFAAARTDQQRGRGVFERSIAALRKLNELGYGDQLRLNLVYNPSGLFLAGQQAQLEREFRERLAADFGIRFHNLYCMNNMPISRFLESLLRANKLEEYMSMLAGAFNPATLDGLMCRRQVSVGYDGQLYDCDFNQMLELPAAIGHIGDLNQADWEARSIVLHNHCFACTAGSGSSCGGALSA
ncbi:MAG: arsenosugar biosynthesis radical SAM protein ArsS [Leptospirales bacterium]|nr:arsenosugar biosynthesis radical SAM protein ArsS [Leptospirales bacterium]